jgi:hypothetical protein
VSLVGPNAIHMGISLPPYFRPTPSVKKNNTFFPQTEDEIPVSAFTPPGLQRDLVRKFPAELEGMGVPLSAMFEVPEQDR